MSLLDDNLEKQLSEVIYKDLIDHVINLFSNHDLRIIREEQLFDYAEYDIYYCEYRTDKLMQLCDDGNHPPGKYILDYPHLVHAELNQCGDYTNLYIHKNNLSFYLEDIPRISFFTYVKLLIENDRIVLEPCNKTAPILIKNLNNYVNEVTFRCPDWYKGYIKAVDCSPFVIQEMFKDFMVISEESIIQTLPR